MVAWLEARAASPSCNAATSLFSCADLAVHWSIFEVIFSISAILSASFSSFSDSSLSQKALCSASAAASASSLSIMSAMSALILAKGSALTRAAEAICMASWASAVEFCFCARLCTKRTAATSELERSWRKEYVCEAAPEVVSWMILFASAMALSSSPRLFCSASNVSAFSMQSEWRVALVLSSDARSAEVAARSPSASAFALELAASPFFASSKSAFPFLISSFRFCASTW
mmetsp:Transcript_14869/g.39652  ORF Transcript_14869/g.39652 Transcript_14869/m.39652 type:complete len:232 (-) Transcript_14869:792-1487(-)